MKTGIAIAGTLIVELAMALILIPRTDHKHIETSDFVNFYAAATIVRQGHAAQLYRAETQEPVLQAILGRPVTEYFLHPPFEAAALAPLSYLTIERAFVIWALFNLALLGMLPLLFAGAVPLVARRPYLGLLGFVFPPVLIALTLGQDSIIILFVMSVAYLLQSRNRDLLAGLVLSLATVKFQYVLILVLLLAVSRKFRLVAGFAAGCLLLGLISVAVTGLPGILEYIRFIHDFDSHGGYGSIHPELMVNWRGFLAGLGFDNVRLYSSIGSILLICAGIFCSRWARNFEAGKLIFALYISIALAASPYAFFEDETILLLPVFLGMDWVLSRRKKTGTAKIIGASCGLMFAWPVILMACGGHYWWNSRIYLVFPLTVFFIGSLMVELYHCRAPVLETA